MTNEELVQAVQHGGGNEYLAKLYEQNTGIIGVIAGRYACDNPETLEDLKQEAYFALVDAVNHYDPGQGSFVHYLTYWLRQAMIKYLKTSNTIRIPVNRLTLLNRYRKLIENHTLTDAEIAERLEINPEQLRQLKKDNQCIKGLSLSMELAEGFTIADTIADPHNAIEEAEDRLAEEHLASVLWSCVDELPKGERAVIIERYRNGRTGSEAADALGLSSERVRQLHDKAIRRLRSPRNIRKYNDALEGLAERYAYHPVSFWHDHTSPVEAAVLKLEELSL